MDFNFGSVLNIIGSLAFFIYGMKMMSDGIQRAAGSQLRSILRTMTQNRFLGVFTGFLITLLIQSSSATTVMTVSFVNAGLLSLTESAGVMIGANIGTTITGWIVSVLGFKVKLSAYSIPLFAFGVPMVFAGKGKVKYWGQFIIGFAILFLGLSELKSAVPDLKGNPEALEFLAQYTQWGIFSRILFVIVGTLLTIIVQSSSASMAITLTLCANGLLPFDVAAAMILGENIGTTITAELASLIGNTSARRSARIHSLFNTVGVAWMVIVLPWFLPVLSNTLQDLFPNLFGNPYADAAAIPLSLAAFHTAFNTINVCLVLPFVPLLVRAATYTVKDKDGDNQVEKLQFITNGNLTPELNTDAVQKETAHFGDVIGRMNGFLKTSLNTINNKEKDEAIKRLFKYEEISDMMEIEITEYITNLADKEITSDTSTRLRSYMNIANDLERIADIYFQIAKTLEQKIEERIYFLPEQRNGLNQMLELVDKAFQEMNRNLAVADYSTVDKSAARQLEDAINDLRDQLRSNNLDRLGNPDYKVKAAMIYNNLFSSLERIGDHIINVTESVVGEI
ncbi:MULTISPECIES: Na/Pi cotransporter family protein [unclassified Aureispira]|uniref:Na/Pi cotransporter family protein n=1 Tax=unclassified Aureispira TaxID=2649989 RepID=UPI000697DC47|nr:MULTISPECIES: Na/Pi cotransporter family protein [unclassified Aureispira]WMX13875.1 Na/Pi cotransporter family protein [Aureispira sp. CCB-E]